MTVRNIRPGARWWWRDANAMISRRDFLTATAAATSMSLAGGYGPLARIAAQQRLTQADILRFEPTGTATILYMADTHAQLLPLHFREPSVNIGAGADKGRAPHLTDAAFREAFGIAAGSPEAFAFTAQDFAALAQAYGRMGGMDRIATLIRRVRDERGAANVLLLDGGDALQGSWSALQTRGQDMVEVMAALGVAATVGHWEFTLGAAQVRKIADTAPFAFLAQNIRDDEWQEPVFAPRKMFTLGGVTICVIGQAFPRTPVTNPRHFIPGWTFGIREEDLQRQVDAARAQGAQVVVLLSHNGFDVDRKLAGRVRGLDIILTAHTHDALPVLVRVGETLLAAAGSHGKFLARLDLNVAGGRLTDVRFKLMPVFADAIAPDADMAALVGQLRAPFASDLAREIGGTESLLYRRGNFNGTLDDLICDALLAERDSEIAFSPGFRWGGTLLPGDPITFEAITNASAITYPASYRVSMTGGQIKDLLEDVADNLFHPDPYFQSGGDMVRAGGLGYAIDVDQPIGRRISDLTLLKTGLPLEATKSYAVSGWASTAEAVEGPPIWDVLSAHVRRLQVVRMVPNAAVKRIGG